ncbi:hypothetical protein VNI00_017685 [Paramarasmius palmivorus]|uniref:Uncharacterized protein n=1 Tax=Paramarasmius palmivorus TaxID=297713 RepID=A0AAW0B538_9AGAR
MALDAYIRKTTSNEYLYQLYGKFFTRKEQESFRSVQAKTNALVSGSTVLAALTGGSFEPNDLDILVNKRWATVIGEFLEEATFAFEPLRDVKVGEKYASRAQPVSFRQALEEELKAWTPNTGSSVDRYRNRTIAGVFNFERKGRRVQIICVHAHPLATILHFHSTAVMNFATDKEIFALYPFKTIIQRKSLVLQSSERDDIINAIQKYKERGWEPIEAVGAGEALNSQREASIVRRRAKDSHSIRIPLPEEDVRRVDSEDAGLDLEWVIEYREAGHARIRIIREGEEINCPVCTM